MCQYCGGITFHEKGCPFFEPEETGLYCTECREPILKEDEHVEIKGKWYHKECLKRACFCWGVGRELYTAPFIWIKSDDCKITEDRGVYKCQDRFIVSQIGYDEKGNINSLKISNGRKEVFRYGAVNNPPEPEEKSETPKTETDKKDMATEAQIKVLRDLTAKHGVNLEKWAKAGGKSIGTLTAQDAGNMLATMKRKYGEA